MLKVFRNMSPQREEDEDEPAVQVGIKGLIEFVFRFTALVVCLLTGFIKAAVGVGTGGSHSPFFTSGRFTDGRLPTSPSEVAPEETGLSGSDVLLAPAVSATSVEFDITGTDRLFLES